MFDRIEKIDNSLIQHGPNNDRIYVLKLAEEDCPTLIEKIHDLSILKRYTKIVAKVPDRLLSLFLQKQFKVEATIPGFFKTGETAHFVSLFLGASRSYISAAQKQSINDILVLAKSKLAKNGSAQIKLNCRKLVSADVQTLVNLYRETFNVYPFPIFDTTYIENTMDKHIDYFGVFKNEQLIAAASAEKDLENHTAEMTDFATLPDYRGNNLSYHLLTEMEKEMMNQKIEKWFTIARAESIGMNVTFAKARYQFGGTLINNTLIGAGIESMNVWYKHIS